MSARPPHICPPCWDGDHGNHRPHLGGICVGCSCEVVATKRVGRCTCAEDGNAARCALHTQADFVASARREPTDAEVDVDLRLEGFDPDDRYPEHGYDALRRAYRAGWDAARHA